MLWTRATEHLYRCTGHTIGKALEALNLASRHASELAAIADTLEILAAIVRMREAERRDMERSLAAAAMRRHQDPMERWQKARAIRAARLMQRHGLDAVAERFRIGKAEARMLAARGRKLTWQWWRAQRDRRIVAMRRQGASLARLARRFGLSIEGVRRVLARYEQATLRRTR